MNALRLWIIGAALGSFAAGAFVGQILRPEPALAAGLARERAFAEELAVRYGLSAEQHRKLFLVLRHAYERKIEILGSVYFEALPQPQQGELRALEIATEHRTRKLLDAGQLARYDRDSRPVVQEPAASDPQKK